MIRPLTLADLPACGALYAQAFPPEHWGVDWTPDTAREYLLDYLEQKRFVGFVDEENGEIRGCLFALRKRCGSREELYINEMAVLPAYQGRGIGRQLLDAAKAYARDHALAGIVLYTSEYAPAARFYAANGFQRSPGVIGMYCT